MVACRAQAGSDCRSATPTAHALGPIEAIAEEAQTVLVSVGNRTTELPAGSLSANGEFATAATSRDEIPKLTKADEPSAQPLIRSSTKCCAGRAKLKPGRRFRCGAINELRVRRTVGLASRAVLLWGSLS
jgi:CO dehydrogenase/acetyl-CoA synthase alpha subunit